MVTANETFSVFTLKTGRVVIENPLSQQANAVMVVSDTRCFVSGGPLPTLSEVASSVQAHAIVGVVSLCLGRFVLVATDRRLAATIQSHKIWRVTKGQAVRVGPSLKDVKSLSKDDLAKYYADQSLLEGLLNVINAGQLFYSQTYDLTHSLQHNYFAYNINPSGTLVDDRYFFNRFLCQPFLDLVNASTKIPWISKMICGYAGAVDIPVQASPNDTKIFTVALISRLSTLRVGTRYIRRGLDLEGNAANSVEMEQVVFNHDYHTDSGISSYVQLRGSAPLIWAQQRDLAYQPSIVVADVEKPEVWAAVEAHLFDLRAQYTADKSISDGKDFGKVICVNLLDDKGREAVISKTYEQVIAKFNDAKVVYEDFPINKWCRNMDYTNMSVLVDRINDSLVNTQVFVGNGSVPSISIQPTESRTTTRPLTASKIQTGVARTSCLDSLDRTNLTCTLFARHMLAHQLLALTNPSVYSKPLPTPLLTNFATSPTTSQELESYPEIGPIRLSLSNPKSSKLFTNLWADSGDAISLLYAGTRALRSDITRTGKRSWVHGSLDDGINSLTRYYLNNFVDGKRQDAWDLWTGKVGGSEFVWEKLKAEGQKNAEWAHNPSVVAAKGAASYVVPATVVDAVEPIVQESVGFVSDVVEDQILARLRKVRKVAREKVALLKGRSLVAMNANSMDDIFGEGSGASKLRELKQQKLEDAQKTKVTTGGFLVNTIKLFAPQKITNAVEFFAAMTAFFYIALVSFLFGVKGAGVVDRPKLSEENRVINELMSE
ncbi:hypothetical protein HDU79_011182 [Rhizoclosmatium sp. JEL0117]|nr:hypothetical protein HDU79_011182 [Rhizoclosmatium sp. JEL0117]